MTSVPIKKSLLSSVLMGILLTPFAIGFVIAACLSGGPSEVFRALTGRE